MWLWTTSAMSADGARLVEDEKAALIEKLTRVQALAA
jgi:phenylpyruvate tautomerase PptA (4-oxalocrotonate tautomerase family)